MDTELTATQSVLGSLLIAVLLTALHLAVPRIRGLLLFPERAMGSFAGGLAVAYVFLHLLPEIAEGDEAVGEALSDVMDPTPLTDLGIFLVALAGFTLFYGLEQLADRHPEPAADEPAPAAAAPAMSPAGMYWLHLGSFVIYNGLITYTMALRLRTGVVYALLFTVALGLHFVLTDRGLQKRYPRRFPASGRPALAAALLAGWALSALAVPTSTLLVTLLTALLGGSILLNVFKEEIPSDRDSSFPWFLTGLSLYAVLLALVTAQAG